MDTQPTPVATSDGTFLCEHNRRKATLRIQLEKSGVEKITKNPNLAALVRSTEIGGAYFKDRSTPDEKVFVCDADGPDLAMLPFEVCDLLETLADERLGYGLNLVAHIRQTGPVLVK